MHFNRERWHRDTGNVLDLGMAATDERMRLGGRPLEGVAVSYGLTFLAWGISNGRPIARRGNACRSISTGPRHAKGRT